MDGGTAPLNVLDERSRILSLGRLAKLSGSDPVRAFEDRFLNAGQR
jgi:hypothetical protein